MVELVKRLAAEFFERESNRTAMVSITDVVMSSDGKRATIFVSIYPTKKESEAIGFLKRNRGELREYILERSKAGRIPFLEVDLDVGEKHRQRIDELLRQ